MRKLYDENAVCKRCGRIREEHSEDAPYTNAVCTGFSYDEVAESKEKETA